MTADPMRSALQNRPMLKCSAKRRNGEACKAWAVAGMKVCRMHGGASPQAKAAAQRRLAEAAAVRAVEADAAADLAHAALRPVKDPVELLAMLASEAAAWKDALAARVNALMSVRFTSEQGAEQLRSEVALYERAMDRTAKLCESLAKLGLEDRRVRLDEQTADLVAGVIRAILDDLGLTVEQQGRVPEVVPRHLRLLASGGA